MKPSLLTINKIMRPTKIEKNLLESNTPTRAKWQLKLKNLDV
jgi:hypothetical protein